MKTTKKVKKVQKPVPKKPLSHHQKVKRVKQRIRRSKPIHRRLLLHPITIFILLCLGVLLVRTTLKAAAGGMSNQIYVRGKVAAPILVDGATITAPRDNDIITTTTTTVWGSCPLDSYILLYRNDVISGVGLCNASNYYEIVTSVFPGLNTLKVQAYNLTDDIGPATPEVNVTYTPPPTPEPAPSGGTSTPGSTTTHRNSGGSYSQYTSPGVTIPLMSSDYRYQGFSVNSAFEWDLEISGGTVPYNLHIDWGDNSSSDQQVKNPGAAKIKHVYKKTGNFVIKVKVTDANGTDSVMQLVAIIKASDALASAGVTSPGSGSSFISSSLLLLARHWLVVAWGTYWTILLMVISFWLGERQEYATMLATSRIRKSRQRQHRS